MEVEHKHKVYIQMTTQSLFDSIMVYCIQVSHTILVPIKKKTHPHTDIVTQILS